MKKQDAPRHYTPGWMESIDGRTMLASELRNRYTQITDDLGGHQSLSYQQKSLVDRALFLELHLQQQEQALASGDDFDSGRWVQACNALQGIFSKLGLEKRVREVADLGDFLKKRKGQ